MALITLDEVKEFLRITDPQDDVLLQSLIDGTEAQVKKYVNNAIEKETSITEYFNIDRKQRRIYTKYFPISNVKVYENNTLLTENTDYVVDYNSGLITRIHAYFAYGYQIVKVVYDAGYDTIPDDIKLAVKIQVAFYYQRKDQIGIAGQSLEGSINITEKYGLLDTVKEMLDKYKGF